MKRFLFILLFVLSLSSEGITQTNTNIGTDFWVAFPPNQSSAAIIQLYISSNFSTSGTLSSAYPGVNQNFSVTPGVVTQINLPSGVVLSGGTEDKGIHILANDPIAVYGLNNQTATTDAFLALPVNALGTDYRVLTYTTAMANNGSSFSIVATQNATTLTIFNHQTSSTFNVNLNAGQTYHVESPNVNDDLTGSRVQSNFPVAVYGSVKLGQVPVGCTWADHMVEEMFPCYSWGKNYVTVPLAGRDASGDRFRVLAAEDGTDVSVNGTIVATLNAGDHYEANLAGYNSIDGSKAVLVAQYAKGQGCSGNITGDPLMMLLFPREQYLTNYTIINVNGVTPFSAHWVNLMAPDYAVGTIYQDGSLIPASSFIPIGTTNFYGAQISMTQGTHSFNSVHPFGISIYGWRSADSYGYPGGGSMSHVATVDSISLSPDTLYGTLNVTNVCLTARVLDDLMSPVENVLVTFHVYGINPLTGTAYTDAAGYAQYCYAQTGTASGVDHVYAEAFSLISDTSVVYWTYLCSDPVSGGTIGSDQSGCGAYTPQPLTNIALPTGYDGTLEYKWQQSVVSGSSGFTDIAGTDSPAYSPGSISVTTWFRRVARVSCKTDWTTAAVSNVVELTVLTVLPVSVNITASANNVCAGTQVTFTAFPVNGGSSPSYQWKVNGGNAGSGGPVFSYPPVSGDVVSCTLTSSGNCTSGNPANSNSITMTVISPLPVSILISASPNPFCNGTPVTFTANPTNGGTTPAYQWKVNGFNSGANNPVYVYSPISGDIVSCVLTSSETCTSGNPATSNAITMTGIAWQTAGVSITAAPNPFCPGASVTCTANAVNGGSSPSYQWKVNGVNAGTNSSTFIFSAADNDSVRCVMTSNLNCVTGNPASSGKIILSGSLAPFVTFTTCFDSITSVNARPIKLKGGVPPGGVYSGPGVNSATGEFSPSSAGSGMKTITYTYTNFYPCSTGRTRNILVQPVSAFSCGNTLTDIRDNSMYPTVLINGQCWMAKNLNYGTVVSAQHLQYDNCQPEKYCFNDQTPNCSFYGGLYQWDELMGYEATAAAQGLCPPGWHIPAESEWTALFSFYSGNGLAGKPLQDTIITGFRALRGGVSYLSSRWDFMGFAALFWSSSSWGTNKALSHGMNTYNFSVSIYWSSRASAFPARCLKD